MTQDRKRNLEDVGLFASMPARHALQAAFVMSAAQVFFHKYAERGFFTHPANTLPFASLRALENESVVHLAEIIRDEHKLRPLDVSLRGAEQLLVLRDVVSHPMTVNWRSVSAAPTPFFREIE
jgi:hypothetical protein